MQSKLSVVTGAFGYTGRYIARRLLDQGESVRTLTRNPASRSPFGIQVETRPLDFGNYEQLVASLTEADTFFNTYWIRFPRSSLTYETATSNSLLLIRAAVEAGIRRIVHISITNASEDSSLRYFRGKGVVERAIHESGLSYAILRPTVLYSLEDVLINNMAWFLRQFPVFPIAGSGDYPIQPVLVDDVARLAVDLGARNNNVALDAVGPEIFTFEELVRLLARRVGRRVWLMHLPPALTSLASQMAGLLVRDVVLTKDEVDGLMAGLLVSGDAPTTSTRFTEWLQANGANVGRRYASELGRHYR